MNEIYILKEIKGEEDLPKETGIYFVVLDNGQKTVASFREGIWSIANAPPNKVVSYQVEFSPASQLTDEEIEKIVSSTCAGMSDENKLKAFCKTVAKEIRSHYEPLLAAKENEAVLFKEWCDNEGWQLATIGDLYNEYFNGDARKTTSELYSEFNTWKDKK